MSKILDPRNISAIQYGLPLLMEASTTTIYIQRFHFLPMHLHKLHNFVAKGRELFPHTTKC